MLKTTITRRFVTSILLVVCISLAGLGVFLLKFFYDNTMQQKQEALLCNAHIIETALGDKLWTKEPDLKSITNAISQNTNLRITILDQNGQVLADTSEPAEELDNHLQRQEVQQALYSSTGYGSSTRYSKTLHENLMYTAIPVYHQGQVTGIIRTAASLSTVEYAYQQIRYSILAALLMAMLASVALAFWLASHQLKPLLYTIRTAHEISQGNLARRIYLQTGDEFESLGHAINKLTAALTDKIQEARSESHKFSLILEQMDNAVMLIDKQGHIHTANRRACQLFPILLDKAPHHSIHVLDNAELSETARALSSTEQSTTMVIRHEQHTFEVFLSAFQNKLEPEVLAVFHDISILQELNQRQAEFTGNAAHELATPLTSIAGFAELLQEDDFSSPEESHHYAEIIYQQTQRMNRLIQDLLQLTRLQSKTYRHQLPMEVVDGSRLLQAAVKEMQAKTAAKRQKLVIETLDEQAKIKAVPDLLEQVLRNLMDNACKYTQEQGIITVSCQLQQQHVIYRIQDNGIGIPEKALPRIFDRFYRVDKARDRKRGGNGIGLSLVKFLVELFAGTITAESTLGQGSTFTLTFPLADDDAEI